MSNEFEVSFKSEGWPSGTEDLLIANAGTFAFGTVYDLVSEGLPPGGVFQVGRHHIRVKSVEKAYNLLRPVDLLGLITDIWVLAEVDVDERVAYLMGWEFDRELITTFYPPKIFNGVRCHYKHVSQLKHMSTLGLFLKPERE